MTDTGAFKRLYLNRVVAGTTRYLCPLPGCGWHYDQAPPSLADMAGISPAAGAVEIGDIIGSIATQAVVQRAGMAETAVREHLESHPLVDWARALTGAQRRVGVLEREAREGDEEYAAVKAELEGLRGVRAANARAWEVVKLWRLESLERGESQFSDPKAQALSSALVGTDHHQATVEALKQYERPHGPKA